MLAEFTIDWGNVKDVSETAAALLAIYGSVFLAIRLGLRIWKNTIGLRRSQAEKLDALVCGEPVSRVNTWLGLPVSIGPGWSTYELPGGWVHITVRDGMVESFAITIRNARLYYRSRLLMFGMFDLKLGQATFKDVNLAPGDGITWIGARRMYARVKGFGGNPYMYQHYWLAYNDAGAGSLSPLTEADIKAGRAISSDTTINTLRVAGPGTDAAKLIEFDRSAEQVGVDYDRIRLRLAKEFDRYERRQSRNSHVKRLFGRKAIEK